MKSVWIACLLLFAYAAGAAQYSSGPQRVTLLELYTSQGCSSCPPADRWLSGMKDDARLWQTIVPVAFHVDYWNYIGWADPYSNPQHSNRQRNYAREASVSQVYTPGFVANGQEWRGWFKSKTVPVSTPLVGDLSVRTGGHQARVQFTPRRPATDGYRVHLALLGMDISTPVARGENRGRELAEDFVVLDTAVAAMHADGDSFIAELRVPVSAAGAPRHALAVWVSSADSQRPLQATGGWYQPGS